MAMEYIALQLFSSHFKLVFGPKLSSQLRLKISNGTHCPLYSDILQLLEWTFFSLFCVKLIGLCQLQLWTGFNEIQQLFSKVRDDIVLIYHTMYVIITPSFDKFVQFFFHFYKYWILNILVNVSQDCFERLWLKSVRKYWRMTLRALKFRAPRYKKWNSDKKLIAAKLLRERFMTFLTLFSIKLGAQLFNFLDSFFFYPCFNMTVIMDISKHIFLRLFTHC